MNRLKLVLPIPEYKEKLINYKREFIENGDSMDGHILEQTILKGCYTN